MKRVVEITKTFQDFPVVKDKTNHCNSWPFTELSADYRWAFKFISERISWP